MSRLDQKHESKNIDVRPYPGGFMARTVEDAELLKDLYGYATFTETDYDSVLQDLCRAGFSLTVIGFD